MDDEIFQVITWVLGTIGTVFVFLFGIWWKIEHKQDTKIDALAEKNGREHLELHDKIDSQHHAIRDRLDKIWQHMRTDNHG